MKIKYFQKGLQLICYSEIKLSGGTFQRVKVSIITANKKGTKNHAKCNQPPSKTPTLSKICHPNDSNSHQSVQYVTTKNKRKALTLIKKQEIYSLIRIVGVTF